VGVVAINLPVAAERAFVTKQYVFDKLFEVRLGKHILAEIQTMLSVPVHKFLVKADFICVVARFLEDSAYGLVTGPNVLTYCPLAGRRLLFDSLQNRILIVLHRRSVSVSSVR